MQGKMRLTLAMILGVLSLYPLSNQWERAFAELKSSELSPDGCIRIETYKPFWILPSLLHRIPHPDPDMPRNPLGMRWDYPMFNRAYEVSTGAFLGETIVFDPTSAVNMMFWNESKTPGRRVVYSRGFPLLDSDRCADEETLSKLGAFYEESREKYAEMMKQWDEQESHWDEDYRQWKKDNPVRVGPPDDEDSSPDDRG